jgi:hypothetical protein
VITCLRVGRGIKPYKVVKELNTFVFIGNWVIVTRLFKRDWKWSFIFLREAIQDIWEYLFSLFDSIEILFSKKEKEYNNL